MDYLIFALDDAGDGVFALEAMASTRAEQHPAVMAEVEQVLAWARQHFPHTHGPVDDGLDWDHDLQVLTEDGGWRTVTLTISASEAFVEAFQARFGPVDGGD
jgi:hypothetical protein